MSHNTTVSKIDLDTGLGVILAHKFDQCLTKTNSNKHEPKIYNEAINNLIYRNRLHKFIDKKLWNWISYQEW